MKAIIEINGNEPNKNMKNQILKMTIIICAIGLFPQVTTAQIPVTDVGANAQLLLLNQNVATLNSQLVTLNSTIGKLLTQMELNVTANNNVSQLITQDVTTKRTPAGYVIGSPEITGLYLLKDKIVEAYKGSLKNLDTFSNLKQVEKDRANQMLGNVLVQVTSLVSQGSQIASTGESIESADRLTALKSIHEKLNGLLDNVIEINGSLLQKNEYRNAVHSLIKTN